MKAIVQDEYGEVDVLRLDDIDRPAIGDGEVLLQVHAAGVDRGVWHLMTGLPYPVRLAGYGVRAPDNPVRGREVAGRVEVVGRDVTGFRPGDEVFGIAEGSFAEYTRAEAGKLVLRPPTLGVDQAAHCRDLGSHGPAGRARPREGAGRAEGAGHRRVRGCRHVRRADRQGVRRPRHRGVQHREVDLVRSLGADRVIDYRRDDIGDDTYDAILDVGGNPFSPAPVPRAHPARHAGHRRRRDERALARRHRPADPRPCCSRRSSVRGWGSLLNSENAADMAVLAELVVSGKVTPAIDRTFPLVDTPAAIRHMTEGRVRGKVIVSVAG